MVEQAFTLDAVFASLSDPTRRDILRRVSTHSMSVGDIARHYTSSLAAIAKHLEVLQRAGLIHKTKRGKRQIVSIEPRALAAADEYLESYRQLWGQRLDTLEAYLQSADKESNT